MARSFITIWITILSVMPVFGQPIQKTRGLPPSIRSALIPGTGEYAVGHVKRSHTFLTSEVLLWTMAIGSFAAHKKGIDYYTTLATEHAGIDPQFKTYQYWIDIGNYDNTDQFNEEHLRWRAPGRVYPRDDTWKWDWDADTNRKKFEKARIASDRWQLVGNFMVGGIFLNHFVSMVDVIYLQRTAEANGTRLSFSSQPIRGNGWKYQLSYWF